MKRRVLDGRGRSQSVVVTQAQRYLIAKRCAACGYDLQAHKPHEDGCVVCPECGAAWFWRASPRQFAKGTLTSEGIWTESIIDDRLVERPLINEWRYLRRGPRLVEWVTPIGLGLLTGVIGDLVGLAPLGCVFGVAVWFVAFIVAARRSVRRADEERAAAMRKDRACRACKASLKDLGPEPDGCTVCPECGGAWRMSEPRPIVCQNDGWRSSQ